MREGRTAPDDRPIQKGKEVLRVVPSKFGENRETDLTKNKEKNGRAITGKLTCKGKANGLKKKKNGTSSQQGQRFGKDI